jgi:hypothetical protein
MQKHHTKLHKKHIKADSMKPCYHEYCTHKHGLTDKQVQYILDYLKNEITNNKNTPPSTDPNKLISLIEQLKQYPPVNEASVTKMLNSAIDNASEYYWFFRNANKEEIFKFLTVISNDVKMIAG